MKYSYNWLQSHIEDPLPSAEVLKETIIFHAFEVEDVEVTATDTIFDIKILPDRAGDALSHYGMAREIAGLLDLNFNDIQYTLPSVSLNVPIDIQAPECLRYSAIRIDGVTVGPSPAWLVKKLEDVGQRSINNVVDATNFILLDIGQPTHVFDAEKVKGSIVVRHATANEPITTLGGEEKVLSENMMVIADDEKSLAIAGVKGGTAAEVTHDTKFVILEVANFDAASVRKTSRSLGLVTDASKRFENNLSPYVVEAARAKLIGLVTLLAGGTVSAVSDHYPNPQTDRAISFTLHDIQQLLGSSITDLTITKVLDRYGYTYEHTNDFYTVDVPYWRQDITGAHDMAEEIGRVTGYDTIEAKPIPFIASIVLNEQYEKIRAIKFSLFNQGYSEVMTYAFRKKGDIMISHGPKDKSALRANLTDAMKESYELNRANAALLGIDQVKEFEIGTVFTTDTEQINIAIADKSGIKEWSVDAYYQEHKDQLIEVDAHTEANRILNAVEKKPFKAWSIYPFITRDIAVWVTEGHAAALETMVQEFAKEHCARAATLFDRFTKEGKTSLAYRLVFQSPEKTLTDAEIDAIFSQLTTAVTAAGMTIR
ncbi:MAG: Phenylalanine--tRNA ligase beta subunit [Candidatus Nomurabacteria bacterium]|nr:Phenylalanine--tRNA ligase beta subunit [Candidatus Nomurabacteria bacterium]